MGFGRAYWVTAKQDDLACRNALALLQGADGRRLFQAVASRYINAKAVNAQDYKYSAAAFEDAMFISERWQSRFLAATTHVLHGPASGDSPLLLEAREVIAKI
jgi:hypothetical protein